MAARAACVEDRANRRKRIAEFGPGPAAAALGRLNDAAECEIGVLDQAIADALEADESLARHAEILRSIAGIGPVATAVLCADMRVFYQRPKAQPKTEHLSCGETSRF